MALYSYGFTSSGVASLNANIATPPMYDILSRSPNHGSVIEVGCHLMTTAGSSAFSGIARSTNTPVQNGFITPTSDQTGMSSARSTVSTAWSNPPVPASNFYRRFFFSTIPASGYIWSFVRGLTLSSVTSLGNYGPATSGGTIALSNWLVINE